MGRKCISCIPTDCETHFLYVVTNEKDGSFKIGCTKNVSRRIAHYRANGADHFKLVFSMKAGCKYTAWRREEKALRSLARLATHKFGDWYSGQVGFASACIRSVCGDIAQ